MHPKLIKANIALFNGARSEARRLLDEYRAQESGVKPTPMMLWIDAQAQDKHDDRVERLHVLLETAGENNRYAHYAQEYIEDERRYSDKPLRGSRSQSSVSIAGVPIWKAVLFAVIGGAAAFIGFSALNPGREAQQPQATQVSGIVNPGDATLGAAAQTPLNLPVQSTPIDNPDQFTAQYTQGNLQIVAIEDNSERATDIRDLIVLNPIEGARFYALKLVFECRAELCENPPEGDLQLQLENGNEIPVLDNVGIHGEPLFQQIAGGRSTQGWVVFQIGEESTPVRLMITPDTSTATETPQPVFIDLPAS